MYMAEAAITSGIMCSLLYDEMSESTLPSSPSMTPRRSLMKSEVEMAIWFLSRIHDSL